MKNSYQDMLAQKLLVGIPDKKSITEVFNLIKKYHIGGVILYKSNYDSLDEMLKLTNKLKESNKEYDIPLFIAIDQECGRVNRLPAELNRIKSSYRQCLSGLECVKKASDLTSDILKRVGVNMNFAPVLDIRRQKDDNAFIGNRAFSSNYEDVIKCGKIWCDELINDNIIPVIKHFPGHGSLKTDSHLFLPIIRDFKEDKSDLKPFKELIKDGVPALMIGHILIKGMTGLRPATLSRTFITDYVRDKHNYTGLIVTDELGMRAVRTFYGKTNSVLKAYEAGSDVICIKYHPGYIEKLLDKLLNDSNINKEEITNSYERIIKYKKEFKLSDKPLNDKIDVAKANTIINEINNMDEK